MTLSKMDKFWRAMDRLDEMHGDCNCVVTVHTPGFFDQGDGYGVGTCVSACEQCATIRARNLAEVAGEAHIRRRGPDRKLLTEYLTVVREGVSP